MTLTGLMLSAQARAVAAGDLSARELAAAHLEKIEASQARLNAFTLVDGERALLVAEQLDRRRAAGEELGALTGVPVGVKDIIDQAGLPTTCGSSFYRQVPDMSAPAVSRLVADGAVFVGRTGLHEFAFGFSSENHWFGPVRNPWDPELSPGGSSGGSGAAVAAGLVAGALGTDTGGSVRVPAAVCGVFGLKVTHGRVPLTGVFPLAPSLDTVGPLARSVEDLTLLYLAMAGPDLTDAWSRPEPVRRPGMAASLRRLRVGLPVAWLDHPLDSATRSGFDGALAALEDEGAELVELTDQLLAPHPMVQPSIYGEVGVVHGHWFPTRADEYGPEVADRLGEVMATSLGDYVASQEWRARLRRAADEALAHVDVIATPTVAGRRKRIGEKTVAVEDGVIGYRRAFSIFASLVNHIGAPAVAMPLAAPGEPPPSLQLIGPLWSEHRLLEIAAALEEAAIVSFRPPSSGGNGAAESGQ